MEPMSSYLAEIVSRLLEAEHRLEAAQAKAMDSSIRESLGALRDYARALADINQYTTETLKERLAVVEARVDLGNRLLVGSTARA
jgi:hypothetical protein